MTNPSTQLRALEGEIERLIPERQCMRYTSGECRTLSCLKAGGYKGGSYDPNIATCEEHALRTLLTLAKELEAELLEERKHSGQSDKELCQLQDALGFPCEIDNNQEGAMERIRDLIAAEGELGDSRESNTRLKRQLDEAMKGLEAYKRLERGAYMNWGYAGGPNECEHGYAEGIPCHKCDQKTAATTLTRITEIDKL